MKTLRRAYRAQERATRLREALADEYREQIGEWLQANPKYGRITPGHEETFRHRLNSIEIKEVSETTIEFEIYDGGGQYLWFEFPVTS